MTTQEIRARLKHCAGLLYAISCDLNNDNYELEQLRKEVEYLRNKVNKKKFQRTEEDKQKRREIAKRYWEKRRAEQQQTTLTTTTTNQPTKSGET